MDELHVYQFTFDWDNTDLDVAIALFKELGLYDNDRMVPGGVRKLLTDEEAIFISLKIPCAIKKLENKK